MAESDTTKRAKLDDALAVPKVELHIHIEGSLQAETIFRLARKNGLLDKLPLKSEEEWTERCKNFADLGDFLNLYYAGMESLKGREDFCDMTFAYLERAHADTVRHVEIFFDPQPHVAHGIAVEDQVAGMEDAFKMAKEKFGMTGEMIFCWQRQLGVESAKETLALMKPFVGRVIGVGADSDYVNGWPEDFKDLFLEARAAGFKVVGHAGEVPDGGGADNAAMASFIKNVGPERVDHGFLCWHNETLRKEMIETGLHMTVCPLSNLCLKVVPSLPEHPIAKLLRAGASVGINSDDPAYLGGFIGANYQACAEQLGMTTAELCQCSRNAANACFASPERKAALLAEIAEFEKARSA